MRKLELTHKLGFCTALDAWRKCSCASIRIRIQNPCNWFMHSVPVYEILWSNIHGQSYSIFQNQRTPSCLGAASSCLAWPRLALPCHALSCLVLSCLGLNVTFFRQIQKMGFIWWGYFNAFFTLFTIWLITVDNHMGKNIDIFWYFEQKHRFINDICWWLGT